MYIFVLCTNNLYTLQILDNQHEELDRQQISNLYTLQILDNQQRVIKHRLCLNLRHTSDGVWHT
jgi:hypothetical protein